MSEEIRISKDSLFKIIYSLVYNLADGYIRDTFDVDSEDKTIRCTIDSITDGIQLNRADLRMTNWIMGLIQTYTIGIPSQEKEDDRPDTSNL